MRLLHDRYTIHPRVPFTIARGSTTAYDRVRVRLIDDAGVEGWGEAAPNAFYGESADTVVAALPILERVVERSRTVESLGDIDVLEEWLRVACHPKPLSGHPEPATSHPAPLRGHPERSEGSVVARGSAVPHASVRAAVSAAAHDLLGKKTGEPVWKLFALEPMTAPPSSFTIVISIDERELLRRVEEAHRYPILKVKLGSDRDEWIVRTVRRAAPSKLLRADANAAWDVPRAVAMSRFLADHGCELIEQPLARDDLDGFRALLPQSPIPVIADESCLTHDDIAALDGAVHGINIKLSKCGGLAEARRMVAEARRRDLRVMIGCMVESQPGDHGRGAPGAAWRTTRTSTAPRCSRTIPLPAQRLTTEWSGCRRSRGSGLECDSRLELGVWSLAISLAGCRCRSPNSRRKALTPNSKLQTPSSKHQAPNTKLQTPSSKHQAVLRMLISVSLPLALHEPLTYAVPDDLAGRVAVGSRVVVPLRRGREMGYVVGNGALPDGVSPRNILAAPDERPVIDPQLLAVCRWIADYYADPLGVVLRTALPAALTGAATPVPRAKRRRVADLKREIPTLIERDAALRARQKAARAVRARRIPGRQRACASSCSSACRSRPRC